MFSEKLKELRLRKNLTQHGLAKALKVSPSTIGMYEQGRREPDLKMLKIFSDFFDVSVDYLLGKELKPFFIDTHYDYLVDLLKDPKINKEFSMTREEFAKSILNAMISDVKLNGDVAEVSFYGADKLSPELKELIDNAKKLTPEQLQKLNEFIETIK